MMTTITTESMTSPTRTDADMMHEAETWHESDLLRLWRDVKDERKVPNWNDGKLFEYIVIRAFQLGTARVRYPYHVTYPQKFGTMEQIDGIVYLGERAFLVESKDFSKRLDIEAVAKLRFRLESRPPGTMGILFSVRGFSLPTEVFTQFAAPLNVLLWGGGDLDVVLNSGKMDTMVDALQQKLKYAIEEGLPLYTLEGAK